MQIDKLFLGIVAFSLIMQGIYFPAGTIFQTIFGLLLLIMSIALAFVVTPILSIILTVTLFTVLVLTGWINLSPSIVITLVIMGGLVIFIKRKD